LINTEAHELLKELSAPMRLMAF